MIQASPQKNRATNSNLTAEDVIDTTIAMSIDELASQITAIEAYDNESLKLKLLRKSIRTACNQKRFNSAVELALRFNSHIPDNDSIRSFVAKTSILEGDALFLREHSLRAVSLAKTAAATTLLQKLLFRRIRVLAIDQPTPSTLELLAVMSRYNSAFVPLYRSTLRRALASQPHHSLKDLLRLTSMYSPVEHHPANSSINNFVSATLRTLLSNNSLQSIADSLHGISLGYNDPVAFLASLKLNPAHRQLLASQFQSAFPGLISSPDTIKDTSVNEAASSADALTRSKLLIDGNNLVDFTSLVHTLRHNEHKDVLQQIEGRIVDKVQQLLRSKAVDDALAWYRLTDLDNPKRHKLRHGILKTALTVGNASFVAKCINEDFLTGEEVIYYELRYAVLCDDIEKARQLWKQYGGHLTGPMKSDTLKVFFSFFKSIKDYPTAVEAAELLIRCGTKLPPKTYYGIAETALYCSPNSQLARTALSKAFYAARKLRSAKSADSKDVYELTQFYLKTLDIDSFMSYLSEVAKLGLSSPDHFLTISKELETDWQPLREPLKHAQSRLRAFSDGSLTTLDGSIDNSVQVVVYIYPGFFCPKPSTVTIAAYLRKAYLHILTALTNEKIPFTVVPQLTLSEYISEDATYFRVSYHTLGSARQMIHIKEADLPHQLYFDTRGYSGWSELGQSKSSAIKNSLQSIDDTAAREFFRREQVRVITSNQSKYLQPSQASAQELPGDYVFVALQTIADRVQQLAYVPMLTMLDMVISRFVGTGISVVIKRHPACRDSRVEQALALATQNKDVLLVNESIHRLIKGAKAVFTVNSGVGVESLLHLKPVYVFGNCDYKHCCHVIKDSTDFLSKTRTLRKPLSDLMIMKFIYYYRHVYLVDASNTGRLVEAVHDSIVREVTSNRSPTSDGPSN